MKSHPSDHDSALRAKALDILRRELTPLEYTRFFFESNFGSGDYTAERHARLDAEESTKNAAQLSAENVTRTETAAQTSQPARRAS